MAIKKYLRRKKRRSLSTGSGQQTFFKAVESEQHDTENNSFFSPASERIQTQMKVSQPGDAQELEADHMAERVTNSSTTNSTLPRATKEEEKVSRVAKEEEE